jgi:hypothetical protein
MPEQNLKEHYFAAPFTSAWSGVPRGQGMHFERLEPTMRGIVLRAALPLFDDWPFHFVEVMRSVNASPVRFMLQPKPQKLY